MTYKLVSPKQFGEMLEPQRSERTIYRWLSEPNGLPFIELNGAIRIDPDAAWQHIKSRERQRVTLRKGRRANRISQRDTAAV